jgi:hypothetical protein
MQASADTRRPWFTPTEHPAFGDYSSGLSRPHAFSMAPAPTTRKRRGTLRQKGPRALRVNSEPGRARLETYGQPPVLLPVLLSLSAL